MKIELIYRKGELMHFLFIHLEFIVNIFWTNLLQGLITKGFINPRIRVNCIYKLILIKKYVCILNFENHYKNYL